MPSSADTNDSTAAQEGNALEEHLSTDKKRRRHYVVQSGFEPVCVMLREAIFKYEHTNFLW